MPSSPPPAAHPAWAGRSCRCRWESDTVLEQVILALRQGGVDETVVVVGPHDPALTPLAEAAGAHVVSLAEPTPDMRATVEHGLRWLENHYQPHPDDAWLLAPADHPMLDADRGTAVVRGLRGPPVVIHPSSRVWKTAQAIRR